MNFDEGIIALRKRMLDAVAVGVIESQFKDMYENTLLQILNENERQKLACLARAEELRRQAAVIDGQAQAYAQTHSVIFAVVGGLIKAQERALVEEMARAEEKRQQAIDSAVEAAQAESVQIASIIKSVSVESVELKNVSLKKTKRKTK